MSLGLAIAAIMVIRWRANRDRLAVVTEPDSFLRQTFAPPWKWPSSRLVDFVALNVTIAAGSTLGYSAF